MHPSAPRRRFLLPPPPPPPTTTTTPRQVLASLVDSHNNILVPGFYANVRANMLQAALARLEGSHEFSLDGWVREGGGGRDLLLFRQTGWAKRACEWQMLERCPAAVPPAAYTLLLAVHLFPPAAPPTALCSYKQQLGVQELTSGRSEQDLLNARWCQPSLRWACVVAVGGVPVLGGWACL